MKKLTLLNLNLEAHPKVTKICSADFWTVMQTIGPYFKRTITVRETKVRLGNEDTFRKEFIDDIGVLVVFVARLDECRVLQAHRPTSLIIC